MPTYEFECTKCGDRFEVFQRVDEPAPEQCSHCKGQLKKVFHPVGIVFKGSGFYCNDSKKNSAIAPAPAPAHAGNGESKACSSCESAAGGECAKSDTPAKSCPAAGD